MCRLFGFRSNTPEPVHHALVTETNSLKAQSHEHKDGWGIAAWADGAAGAPVVTRGLGPAHLEEEYERTSRLLSSRTVVAHLRLASVGAVVLENAHPFVYRQWAFAHNGTVRTFERHRAKVESLIDGDLRALLRGTTDSERCFLLFLTHLRRRTPSLEGAHVADVARALAHTMRDVSSIADVPGADASSMNFMVSDGDLMVITRRRRTLFVSDGSERAEAPGNHEVLPQFLVASERLYGEGHWHEVPEETVVGVDAGLRLHRWTVAGLMAGREGHAPGPRASTAGAPSASV
jgi:glutamine amidotransferase